MALPSGADPNTEQFTKGRRPKKPALVKCETCCFSGVLASACRCLAVPGLSWPCPGSVLLCVFGLFLAVGVAFQLPGWEGRRVRFPFLFPLSGTDPSTGVSRYPFTYVAVVFLFAVAFVFLFFFVLRLYSILSFTGDFYLSALCQLKYVKYIQCVRWKHWTL